MNSENSKHSFTSCERGAAATELAVSLPVLMLLILGSMQLALLYTAKLEIDYAAFTAARAGSVLIGEDLGDEPAGCIGGDLATSEKLQKIKLAAVIPAIAVSPRIDDYGSYLGATFQASLNALVERVPGTIGPFSTFNFVFSPEDETLSVARGLDADGSRDARIRLAAKLPYAYLATGVEVRSPGAGGCAQPGSRSISRMQDMTVDVVFLYFCSIPVAGRVFGSRLIDLSSEEREAIARAQAGSGLAMADLAILPGYYVTIRSRVTIPAEGT